MSRGSSGRLHGWICWSVIAASVTAILLAYLRFDEAMEMREAGLPPSMTEFDVPTPEHPAPPAWLTAIAWGVVALFLAACLNRRARAWLRMRARLSRPSAHGDTYLEVFMLRALTMALVLIAFWSSGWSSFPSFRPDIFSLLVVLYAVARCRSFRVPLADWGWRRGTGATREISIGVLVGVLLGLSLAPMPTLPGTLSAAIDTSYSPTPRWVFLLGIVVWAPIAEETFYRGALYRYLRDHWRWPTAVLISTAIFTVMHTPPRPSGALFGGVVWALLREWRGSLLAPLAAHATHNLLVTVVWGPFTLDCLWAA